MQVDRYRVVGRLAAGGMAEVLLGKVQGSSGFEQPVVLKRILPHLAADPSVRRMFAQEAQTVAHVRHPNVVRVYELVEKERELFLVMEYLEGETVAGVLKRARREGVSLPLGLAAFIVAEAAAGLHAAHQATDWEGRHRGLVHRDVSPQNIFVTYSGEVKVIDFGIAKVVDAITRASLAGIKGKFSYMSPEQTSGAPLDRRSDVFSLGIVLYELTSGRRLFARANSEKTLRAIREDPIPSPRELDSSYPASLEKICMKALARDPDERYATALDMRRDIAGALRDMFVDSLPEEELSALMKRLFADRIEEKGALLRAGASDGTPSSSSGVLAHDEPADGAFVSVSRRRAFARPLVVAGGVLALAAFGVVAYRLGQMHSLAPSAPTLSAAASDRVTVTISSEPSGAEVWEGRRRLGTTPLELTSEPTQKTLDVELRLPGYERKVIKVVPDANTALSVELVSKTGS